MSTYHPPKSEIDWYNKNWLWEHYCIKKLSWREIGEIVNRSSTAVRLVAKKLGITSRTTSEATFSHDINFEDCKKLYQEGYSLADIAGKLNVPYSVIYRRFDQNNYARRKAATGRSLSFVTKHDLLPRDKWANKSWLEEQYKNKSINEIAEHIGWSYTAVHDTMVSFGIEMRTTSGSLSLKWLDKEYKTKCLAYSPPGSSLQLKLYALLDELGMEYVPEGPQTNLLKYYRPLDCLIPSRSLVIEVHGYYHLQPKIMSRDNRKIAALKKERPDLSLVHIWDHELWSTDVVDKICRLIGIDVPKAEYSFKDLSIETISYSDTKKFLQLYHYLGKGRGGKCVGVKLGDKLIAVMVFSPPLRQNTAKFFGYKNSGLRELSRLCVHPVYHKKNLISWALSRAMKMINCRIIAYADNTVGHTGACYKACNFTYHHEVPADYWYVNSDGYRLHKKTLYNKARNARMVEYEFANYFGYKKIKGDVKHCFISPETRTASRLLIQK